MNGLKIIQTLTLATLLVLALGACSNKDNNDTNATGQTAGTAQDAGDGGTGSGTETNATTTDSNTSTETNSTVDVTPPVLTLNGESNITLEQNTVYTELGATALDAVDGNVSVSISGNVDTATVGSYTVTYTAQDSAENEANITRSITVIDVTPPVLKLNGEANITLEQNAVYTEEGATAVDAVDGNLTVSISGAVDTGTVGNYTLTYIATDSAGNEANVTRSVEVVNTAPTLTSITLESNATTVNVDDTVQLTVTGTYSDGSSGTVDENITYIISPTDSAEVNGSVLRAKKDGNVTVQASIDGVNSNTIALNITWIVDGHVLPPEPDPVVNNATLGGVDSNSNGVRDDVERNIYATYPVRLHRGLLMGGAIVLQEIMLRPVEEAKETQEGITKAINCHLYLMDFDSEIDSDEFDWLTFLENKTVNTKERIRKYLDYNIALSGGSYGSSPVDWNRESCSPEVTKTLEEMGK